MIIHILASALSVIAAPSPEMRTTTYEITDMIVGTAELQAVRHGATPAQGAVETQAVVRKTGDDVIVRQGIMMDGIKPEALQDGRQDLPGLDGRNGRSGSSISNHQPIGNLRKMFVGTTISIHEPGTIVLTNNRHSDAVTTRLTLGGDAEASRSTYVVDHDGHAENHVVTVMRID